MAMSCMCARVALAEVLSTQALPIVESRRRSNFTDLTSREAGDLLDCRLLDASDVEYLGY